MNRKQKLYILSLLIILQTPAAAQKFYFNTSEDYVNNLYEEKGLKDSSNIQIVSPERKKQKMLKVQATENKVSSYSKNLEKKDLERIKKKKKYPLMYSKKKAQAFNQTKYKSSGYMENGGYIYSTVDAFNVVPKLNIVSVKDKMLRSETTLSFYIYSNYRNYINKYEILIYGEKDTNLVKPLSIIKGETLPNKETINVSLSKKMIDGNSLTYVLKVYDKKGNFDITNPRKIEIFEDSKKGEILKELKDIKIQEIDNTNNLKKQDILINGALVKVIGKNFPANKKVQVGELEVFADNNGSFILENIYSSGDKEIQVLALDLNDKVYQEYFNIKVKDSYNFTTGLVDLSIGQNKVDGNDTLTKNDKNYESGHFDSGRIAIYHKQKTKDMKLTVHVDTKDEKIENVIDGLERREQENVLTRIDDYQIYDSYGDDSKVYSDIDTQGKVYIKLEKNKSKAIWGNYDTKLNENYFSNYNRSLYGAYLNYKSLKNNKFGDSKNKLVMFASEPNTLYNHNEFLGTGGSLYYLNQKDIVSGSAQVWLDVKDKNTGRRISRVKLQNGTDYELDNFLGRLILEKPLSQIAKDSTNEVIKSNINGDYNYYLNVDYEYYSYGNDFDNLTYGLTQNYWINDNVALGGTYIREDRDASDYEMMGVNTTLKLSDNSYLKLEAVKSEGEQTLSSTVSLDGGLNFTNNKILSKESSGNAYNLKGMLSLKDLNGKFKSDDKIETWARIKEKGFANVSEESTTEYENYGLKGTYNISDKTSLISSYEYYDEKTSTSDNRKVNGSIALKNIINDKLTITGETKYEENNMSNPDADDYIGKATLFGLKGEYELNDRVNLNASAQTQLWKDDKYSSNNLYTIGSDIKVNDKVNVSMSGSTGDRGDYGKIQGNYSRTPKHDMYLGYTSSNEVSENKNTLTMGESYKLNDKSKLYHENQFIDSTKGDGTTEVYGINYGANDYLTLGTSYEKGFIEKDTGDIKRDSISIYSRYEKDKIYLKNKLEYRKDREPKETTDQWGILNKGKYVLNDELTFTGKLNYYFTDFTKKEDTSFKEFGIGFAYRPIYMDKLNVLTNYTYLEDLGTEMQSKDDGEVKAHVVSIEGIYQLNQKLNFSLKYALRQEKERINRTKGVYVESRNNLFAFKTSYDLIYNYEIFAEYHILKDEISDNIEDGFILGMYKDFNTNVKLGIGYNFTNYDDNLEVLDYKANGWFVNLIGKF